MTANKPSDLLPCPFCGGEAYSVPQNQGGVIRCGMCDARMVDDYSVSRAIAAWNRRAPVDRAEPVAWLRRGTESQGPCVELMPPFDVWVAPRDTSGKLLDVPLYASPPPEPELVRELRELAESFRERGDGRDLSGTFFDGVNAAFTDCADELESLIKRHNHGQE